MVTSGVDLKNSSLLLIAKDDDFRCCCSVDREEFESIGASAVYVFNVILLVPISVSATLGNFLVLVSIWRTPSLHSPSNVLLFGLALSDLGVGLVVVPVEIAYYITQLGGFVRFFCYSAVSLRFTGYLLLCTSLATITAISVDMWLSLHFHLRYKAIVTINLVMKVLVGIWLYSAALSMLNIWYRQRVRLITAPLIVLSLLVTTTAYFKVFRIVCHHQAQIHAQTQVNQPNNHENEDSTDFAQKKKSLTTKFLIYCLLLVCYLPYSISLAFLKSGVYSVTNKSIYLISFVLVCFNSTLNPFIYCWRFEKIRAAVIATTKKIFQSQTSSH